MAVYIDQLGRTLDLPAVPKRIVSLVPSQTELLYDLGLREEVVGITKFCLHPHDWYRNKSRVGGTKKYDFEKINALAPDLIIGNKEENEQEQVKKLMSMYPVWMSDIYTLTDAFDMILQLGRLLNRESQAVELKMKIESAFAAFDKFILSLSDTVRVAYFIWRQPYMVAGQHTFINHLLKRCGFQNVFSSEAFSRYPEIDTEQLQKADPDVILLSSEPYPFKEKHISEFRNICKNAKIITVDGELFSWYGSRLLHAPEYYTKLIRSIIGPV